MPRITRKLLAILVSLGLLSGLIVAGASPAAAAPLVTSPVSESGDTSQDLANLLGGTGIVVENGATASGATTARGTFSGADDMIGLSQGVVLSTGLVADLPGSGLASTVLGEPGDADVTALAGYPTFDATVLEFEVIPVTNQLELNYVFSSSEYYESPAFNDAFGIWINGQNCAKFPSGQVVTQSHLKDPFNAPYMVLNTTGDVLIQQNFWSVPLTCLADVTAGESASIKIAIADASDGAFDSAIFLGESTLASLPTTEINYNGDLEVLQDGTAHLSAVLVDADTTSPLSNKQVDFTLNGQEYSAVTDVAGVATATSDPIGHPPGTILPVTASFISDGEYASSVDADNVEVVDSIQYDVVYDGNGATGGSPPGTQSGELGSDVTVEGAGSLERTGFTFDGWNTQADGEGTDYAPGNSFTIPASDTTLFAQWQVSQYDVVYNANGATGGSPPGTQSGDFDSTVTIENAGSLERTGFSFVGWNTQADGNGAHYAPDDSFTIPAGNTTLFAQWSVNEYDVVYDANGATGGTSPGTQTGDFGSYVTVEGIGDLERTGFNFVGWNTQADGEGVDYPPGTPFEIPDSDTTLYAQWEPLPDHAVVFDANGGTGSMPDQVTNVPTALDTNTFTRTGYSFTGWNTQANGSGTPFANEAVYPFESSILLYAQWSVNEYDVAYDANGATGGAVPVTQSGDFDSTVTIEGAGSLVRTGFSFVGWNTQADGNGGHYAPDDSFTIPAGNTTLYAQWSENEYDVAYDANGATGGAAPDTQTGDFGSDVTVEGAGSLERIGFTFAGWNTQADGEGTPYAPDDSFTIPASDTTLYAQWEVLPDHTVSFDANGGTGTMADQITNVPTALETNTFTRTGYTFTGWNTHANGSGTAFANEAEYPFTTNTTLFAQWTRVAPAGPTARPAKPKKVRVGGSAFSRIKKVAWSKGPTTGSRAVAYYRLKLNLDRCRTVIFDRKLSKNRTSYKFKRSWLLKRKNSTCSRSTRGEVRRNTLRYRVRVQAVNSRGSATTVRSFIIKRRR